MNKAKQNKQKKFGQTKEIWSHKKTKKTKQTKINKKKNTKCKTIKNKTKAEQNKTQNSLPAHRKATVK